MATLPFDAWVHVARVLDPDDVFWFAQACHEFYEATRAAKRRLRTRYQSLGTAVGRIEWARRHLSRVVYEDVVCKEVWEWGVRAGRVEVLQWAWEYTPSFYRHFFFSKEDAAEGGWRVIRFLLGKDGGLVYEHVMTLAEGGQLDLLREAVATQGPSDVDGESLLDAAVVGIDDKHYGQNIAAYIVKRMTTRNDDDLIQDINQFCIRELGSYKSPAAFRFVTELPRGPSGKVQRLKLLEL